MKYRKLGNTDLVVSELGFGTWPLTGDVGGSVVYGKTDDAESKRVLRKAFDLGITFYDTSDFYGFGHVENLLGETFSQSADRQNLIICTKVGVTTLAGDTDFSTDYMVKSIEESLKRMKTEYIDLYMLHDPSLAELEDGRIISLLDIFKLEGKIREYGISLKTPNDGKDAIEKYGFGVIETNFNMLDQRSEDIGLLDMCKERSIGTIIRTPLSQGLLSGRFQFNNDASDRRNIFWTQDGVNATYAVFKQMLGSINRSDGETEVQTALRYCLSNDAVSTVIPGMKSVVELDENIMSTTIGKFTNKELTVIKHIYTENQSNIKLSKQNLGVKSS
jgi:aryl-alcohol dehydrogenase-like predicted oxidoreductase